MTWIELDSKALHNNVSNLKSLAGKRELAPAVKANAYGHGVGEIVSMLSREQVSYLSVHSLEEAAEIRSLGWGRHILVVGYIGLGDLDSVFDLELEPTVYNIETIRKLGKLADRYKKNANLHLKIETGTNRQGVRINDLKKYTDEIKKHKFLKLKGVSTHFANIEDTTNHSYAKSQLKLFNEAVSKIKKGGLNPKLRHTACSAALLLFEKTRFDMVRPGIAVYGLWPSKETYLSYRLQGKSNDLLEPVLSWKTRIIQIKDVPKDSFVGYGCTYRTTSRTRLAILPIGYSDGYDRSLSNLAYVLIKGKRAPVRGRVCMNLMMVDITDITGVRLEDEVTLIGGQEDEYLSADSLADWSGTVNYEIVSRINGKIRKIII